MGCISLLIVRCAVLTTNLIRAKIHSSSLSSFQAGTSVWGTYLGVFLKTLIISNSEILETGSELIQTSSELNSTSSELIRTIAELFLTTAHRVVQTTAGRWESTLNVLI
jgi:hypothetical protein